MRPGREGRHHDRIVEVSWGRTANRGDVATLGLTDGQTAFYATAAQVIPVLLLTFGLELSGASVVRDLLSSAPRRLAARVLPKLVVAVIAVMCLGEMVALSALLQYKNGANEFAGATVMTALVVGLVTVFFGLVASTQPTARALANALLIDRSATDTGPSRDEGR